MARTASISPVKGIPVFCIPIVLLTAFTLVVALVGSGVNSVVIVKVSEDSDELKTKVPA